MHFCQLRKLHQDPSWWRTTSSSWKTQILSLLFGRKLSFIPHINYFKAKCKKTLNILKVVSHYDWGADRKVLLWLYRALVRSKLDYGSIVYGSTGASYIKCLDPIHNQGLRLCLGAFRTAPMESLYVEANDESLYNRRERLSIPYALKLKSTPYCNYIYSRHLTVYPMFFNYLAGTKWS